MSDEAHFYFHREPAAERDRIVLTAPRFACAASRF
jgi:hypothetical protein